MAIRYVRGVPDYDSLSPDDAREELARLLPASDEAEATCQEWGGDFSAHLAAHTRHQARLAEIASPR